MAPRAYLVVTCLTSLANFSTASKYSTWFPPKIVLWSCMVLIDVTDLNERLKWQEFAALESWADRLRTPPGYTIGDEEDNIRHCLIPSCGILECGNVGPNDGG